MDKLLKRNPRPGETDARWRPHTHARTETPKVRFATREEAVAAARRLQDADLDNGKAFKQWPCAYPCSEPECGGWHVGNWSDKAFQEAQRAG